MRDVEEILDRIQQLEYTNEISADSDLITSVVTLAQIGILNWVLNGEDDYESHSN